jgi:hypothetical protein
MKKQQKLTIGDTNIVSLRFPKTRIKNIKNWGKSFVNTLNKAVSGKKLTINQSRQLVAIHLVTEDFPVVPNSIILQLIDAYEERLEDMLSYEAYENASEFRDIIISLKKETLKK